MKKRNKKVNKKRTYFGLVICLTLIVLILAFVILFVTSLFGYGTRNSDDNSITSKKNPALRYKNVIYKIRYDFGAEDYIYLLPNKVIKTVDAQLVYEVQSDCNCMIPTGAVSYTERTIKFSKSSTNKVIKVFNELYEMSGRREINTDNLELTEYQNRILLAVILNDEDYITVEDNIKYDKKNGKMTINDSTDNKIVNKIGNYLNKKIELDFSKYDNAKNTVELAYIGPYSISFIYTLYVDGVKYIDGYSFDYNGDLREVNFGGIRDSINTMAKTNFMNSEMYINNYLQLYANWESVFEHKLFETGNWCFDERLIRLFIPVEELGISNSPVKVIEIRVPLEENL